MDSIPLVIVEGFMSSAGALIWGNFEQHLNHDCESRGELRRRTIFARVGPVSSLHDRACELFYSLVGGTVDYGVKHSSQCGHGRFGRTHDAGLYPEWSVEHPLHFLGHSMGGPTIVKLQWLLSTSFFGEQYHADMILSVNTISSPFRGTQLVYTLGEDVRNAPEVRPFSPGDLLAKGVHVVSYLAPLLPSVLDLHTEARALSFRDASFGEFLSQLRKSDWSESRDATPFDATFQAAEEREIAREGAPNARTYYRSYCATLGGSDESSHWGIYATVSLLRKALAWPMHLSARAVSSFDFSTLRPTPAFLQAFTTKQADEKHVEEAVTDIQYDRNGQVSTFRENDGVVPLFSQWHPFACRDTRCRHTDHQNGPLAESDSEGADTRYERTPPDAGIWHVHRLEDAHHFSVVPFWVGSVRQEAFWRDLGRWLRALDVAHADGGH